MTNKEIYESAFNNLMKAKRLNEMAVASGPKIRKFAKRHPEFIDAYKNLRISSNPEDRAKYKKWIDKYYEEFPEDAEPNSYVTKGTAFANAAANPMKSIIRKEDEGKSGKTKVVEKAIFDLDKIKSELEDVGLSDSGACLAIDDAVNSLQTILDDSITTDIGNMIGEN